MTAFSYAPQFGAFAGALNGLAAFNVSKYDEIGYQFGKQPVRNPGYGGAKDITATLARSLTLGGGVFTGMIIATSNLGVSLPPFAVYFGLHLAGTYLGTKMGRLTGKYMSWKAKRQGRDLPAEIQQKMIEKYRRIQA